MEDKIKAISQEDGSISYYDVSDMPRPELESVTSTLGSSSSIHDSDFSNEFAFFGDGPGVTPSGVYPDNPEPKSTHDNYDGKSVCGNSDMSLAISSISYFRKNFAHPEGSFMAYLHDKSEENVEELIQRRVSEIDTTQPKDATTFYSILPEIREQIWKCLQTSDLSNIRLTCRKFIEEIGTQIGIQLYFCDSEEDSLRLALTTTIQRLIIARLEMSTLGKLILCNPNKLKSLRITGSVSREAIHDILVRCSNIQHLEIDHKFVEQEEDPAVTDWVNGNLFKPEEEIKYVYGCFTKLRSLRFHTSNDGTPSHVIHQLLVNGLLPILYSINSPFLKVLDIKICVTLEESKLLTDALFSVFLKCRNLKTFRLKHYRSDSYTFEPVPNVDQDRKTSQYVLKFSEHRPFPQFQDLHLEMPENINGFFDWAYLLKNQRKLRSLTWDVGGNYWLYPVECVGKSAKSLEHLMLRMIRCYQIVNDEILAPEPLSMGHFHEFIALKTFHIIGMELPTSSFCRMDLLSKTIQNLQIECFQITPMQLKTIYKTLTLLKLLSVNHWNKTRADFMASLAIIGEMIAKGRKYRALTFLEKSMYTYVEQLAEMNKVLDKIKTTALGNNYTVDEISGDNGIGFILVINSVLFSE